MKHKYLKENEEYLYVYSSNDCWLIDLDTDIISYKYNSGYFIDFISEHFNYWTNKPEYKQIKVEIFSLLGDQEKEHKDLFNPELFIYGFGGILINGENVITKSILINDDTISFQLKKGFEPKTVTLDEFEDLGLGTIEIVDDEDGNPTIEFYPESGNLHYFMKAKDIDRMSEYLEYLFNGINKIYQAHNLPLINK